MKTILGINGSPRRDGNTSILVSKILEGAKSAGALTEQLNLPDLKVGECIGCNLCWKSGECQQDDDMKRLYPKIAGSDCLVFGTPLYWYGPTALMKGFLDRFYYYCGGEQQGLLKGKEAVLVVVFEENDLQAADATLDMFQRSFDYLGMNFRHRLIVPGVGARGDIWKKTDRVEEAYTLGQNLTR
jgi:multimeric flavodoxin WrbA